LGAYCFFNVNPSIINDQGSEVPATSGMQFHDLLTVSLGGVGAIEHVINETGATADTANQLIDLVSFPWRKHGQPQTFPKIPPAV
jgi:hypothetical protein